MVSIQLSFGHMYSYSKDKLLHDIGVCSLYVTNKTAGKTVTGNNGNGELICSETHRPRS